MKYWEELTRIEDSIIRLSSLESLLRVIASGVSSTNLDDAENSIWYLAGTVEDIHTNLRSEFDNLWDIIRDEDDPRLTNRIKDKYNGGMKKKKMMTDKELP